MNANIDESDAALVLSYRAGDKTAGNTLCLRYQRRLAQFFYNRGIRNREDVEDLVQDTLLQAMQKIRVLHKPESFNSWVFKIANGKKAQWFKAQKRRAVYESVPEDFDELRETAGELTPTYYQPERIVSIEEQLEIVQLLIAQLPKKHRRVLLLSANGVPQKKIAEQLKIETNNVKVRLHRAREELKKQLVTRYPEMATELLSSETIQSLLEKK